MAQLSGLKPAMLVSSVLAVVACYATAPKVCTSVLSFSLFQLNAYALHISAVFQGGEKIITVAGGMSKDGASCGFLTFSTHASSKAQSNC